MDDITYRAIIEYIEQSDRKIYRCAIQSITHIPSQVQDELHPTSSKLPEDLWLTVKTGDWQHTVDDAVNDAVMYMFLIDAKQLPLKGKAKMLGHVTKDALVVNQ